MKLIAFLYILASPWARLGGSLSLTSSRTITTAFRILSLSASFVQAYMVSESFLSSCYAPLHGSLCMTPTGVANQPLLITNNVQLGSPGHRHKARSFLSFQNMDYISASYFTLSPSGCKCPVLQLSFWLLIDSIDTWGLVLVTFTLATFSICIFRTLSQWENAFTSSGKLPRPFLELLPCQDLNGLMPCSCFVLFCLWFCNALAVFIIFCLDGHVFMFIQAMHLPEVLSSPFGRFRVQSGFQLRLNSLLVCCFPLVPHLHNDYLLQIM